MKWFLLHDGLSALSLSYTESPADVEGEGMLYVSDEPVYVTVFVLETGLNYEGLPEEDKEILCLTAV